MGDQTVRASEPPRGLAMQRTARAGPYLIRFAQEAAWREDNRRCETASKFVRSPRLR
jgi:hypothetical protein